MTRPERSLIPPTPPTATQCTAHVLGIVPPSIHALLSQSHTPPTTPITGGIDQHRSGLSFLLRGNEIHLWEHSTQTLHEELVVPSHHALALLHPEHDVGRGDLLAVCVSALDPAASSRTRHSTRGNIHHVYVVSSSTGVVCLWMLDSRYEGLKLHRQDGRNGGRTEEECGGECDASLRLPLEGEEHITAFTAATAVGNGANIAADGWIFAATSKGKMYKLRRTSRPLGLHAKLICHREQPEGMVRGLYNKLFTPKKKMVVEEEEEKDDSENEESIVALIPYSSEEPTLGTSGSNHTPHVLQSPPPRKVARMMSLSPPSKNYIHMISITSSLTLSHWKVSLLLDDAADGIEPIEGRLTQQRLFCRHNPDGSLILDDILDDSSPQGYHSVELITTPTVSTDGRSLLLAVRISKKHNVASSRIYVLRLRIDGDHASSFSIVDAIWLDRYAGEAISPPPSGQCHCVGLVAGDGEGDDTVAYVGFGPREVGRRGGEGGVANCPVTISAICFGGAPAGGEGQPRVKDLDLYPHIVPSIVSGGMSYDSITGGCVFLASSGLLGGTCVRFPRSSPPSGCNYGVDMLRDETVQAIKSHLLSAFRQFMNKMQGGSGSASHASVARSVIPPSIDSCPSSVLSAAAVMASQDFLTDSVGGRSGWLSPSFKVHSPMVALREKMQLHTDFVNFLLYAGAYRKVSTEGRVKLRDHGEMIVATQASFTECDAFLTKLDTAAVDDAKRMEVSKIRHVATNILKGGSENVRDLPSRWATLQQSSMNDHDADLIWITSLVVCNGIGRALRYRQDESALYDVPVYDVSAESSSAPWTSSLDVLNVLRVQLETIDQCGKSLLDNSLGLDADTDALRRLVEDMSAALLGGHRDIVLRDPSNENARQWYEKAKQLSIPLLRLFANSDGDDLVALSTSLTHEHFEGIVQICHDHRKSWMHQGPFSDKQPDETYDLRLMLNASCENTYAHLHKSVDFTTGLDFCCYVLHWYANQGLQSKVFELGKECPDALDRHLRTDPRASEWAWINDLRTGSYESATSGLLNITSNVIWEKETNLSLAKLANKLALSSPTTSGAVGGRTTVIENGLTLISAQRSLQANIIDNSDPDNEVMSASDLIAFAIEKIKSGNDLEETRGFVTSGLEVASTISSSQKGDSVAGAAAVWEAAIQADMKMWKSLAQESSKSVAGIPDEILTRCGGTVFVGACVDLATATDERMHVVGFVTNPVVRERVSQSLGLNENIAKLLLSSAQVTCK
eukprot:CCRYP_012690-RA/>CCRYP_012690-RA protein AED:0.02 eAED:0.02 QI:155/1/1/1/1/1/5/288/1249